MSRAQAGLPVRLAHAARSLAPEQRLVAFASFGLFFSMFLPWYSKTTVEPVKGKLGHAEASLSAFGDFSWVEVSVLLVAVAVLFLLFARAERRPFHLPGGDGFIITLAGGWCAALIFYRLLDKPGTSGRSTFQVTVGVQWGIFVALAAAGLLAYAGTRVAAAHRPEPPLPGDQAATQVLGDETAPPAPARHGPARSNRRRPEPSSDQLTLEEPPPAPPDQSTPDRPRALPRRPQPEIPDGPDPVDPPIYRLPDDR